MSLCLHISLCPVAGSIPCSRKVAHTSGANDPSGAFQHLVALGVG